jgi:hypothetical protein
MSIAEVIDKNDVVALKMYSVHDVNELINTGFGGANVYPIYYAVVINRPDCVRALIDMKVDIDAYTPMRYAPINKAIELYRMECFIMLLNAGADIENTTKRALSRLPLIQAIYMGYKDMALILIDRGASQSTIDFTDPKIHYISKCTTNRLETRRRSLILLTIHKQKQGPNHFTKQDKHVIKMISKHIWSTRFH